MCRNKGLKRPLYLVCLLFEKPQGGHKGPSKKSELKTPKITYVLDGFSKGTESEREHKQGGKSGNMSRADRGQGIKFYFLRES